MLRDQAARERIENELDRNMLVLAGAGAGKTTALVNRMLQCVRTGHARIEHMAAITFTRKAAGEMRERVFEELHALARKVDGEEGERVGAALGSIDQCFVGTIHAFCGRLLRERPLEAGLPPDFTEIEGREAAMLQREAWDRFVQKRFANDDPRLDALEECGLTTEDLFAFFKARCSLSDVALKVEEVPRPDLQVAAADGLSFLEDVRAHLPPTFPEGRDGFMERLANLDHARQYLDLSIDIECVQLLGMIADCTRGRVTLKCWGDERDYARWLRDEGCQELNSLVEPALRQWRQHIYPTAASFVEEAVETYAEERRRKGTLTFFDLLVMARSLLRDHPHVRRALQKRYRVLFVDEFQDTDPIQAEVLLYLTGRDVEERDWTRLAPRPGSLFVVGDDKQSIYRFRRADLDTFRLVGERIEETGGAIMNLNTSFRSLGNLCEWFNNTFSDCFRAHEETYQARFEELFKHRADGEDDVCVRVIEIPDVHGSRVTKIVEKDANRIADFIEAALAGETEFNADGELPGAVLAERAKPGDFMILTRRKTYLSAYARALETRGIPFDIVGGERLGESKELRALVEVMEAVATPENPLPVVGVLRGPLTGLSDDDLYAFRKAGGAFDYRSELPGELPEEVARRVEKAFEMLKEAEAWLFKLTAPAAVGRILDGLGMVPFSALQPMGSSRAGNLLRILALVRQWCDQGMHWLDVARELRALIDEEDYNLEEMTLESGRDDVVRLMNVHQAKGLQAPVVFLADPYVRNIGRHEPSMHVSRTSDSPYLSMPIERSRGYHNTEVLAEPVGWEQDLAEEKRFAEAEEMRLRYVAATRARNLLVVSMYPKNSDSSPWAPLYPCLAGVPRLDAYNTTRERPSPATSYDIDALKANIITQWQSIRASTHEETTVTGEAPDVMVQERLVDGKGMAYGRVVHDLFDAAARGVLPPDVKAYAELLIEEHKAPVDAASSALHALEALRASDLWHLVQKAPVVYTEVPLGVRINGDVDTVQRGIIDLAVKSGDGWVIVDYKTDAFGTRQERDEIVERYRDQVLTYVAHWERITGERVAQKGLWFTSEGLFVPVTGN